MGHIYKITNNINNKSYIGQTLITLTNGRVMGYINRFKIHIQRSKYNYKKGSPVLEKALRKYDETNFKLELLQECDIKDMNNLEDYYITFYDTLYPNGYNLMSGGGNGRILSNISKEKMSKTRLGKKHTEITKERMSISQKGKKVSEETKNILSLVRKIKSTQNLPEEIKLVLEELKLDMLPIYITYSSDNKSYYFIVIIPNEKRKKFSSKKISLLERLKLAIEYKNIVINGYRS